MFNKDINFYIELLFSGLGGILTWLYMKVNKGKIDYLPFLNLCKIFLFYGGILIVFLSLVNIIYLLLKY